MIKRSTALIGAGYWGKNLARNFYELGALHTICERDAERLSSFKEKYPEAKFTTSYTEVLENAEITRIVIAAPAFLHYQLAKQALTAGKDVYVEKPLCLDVDEGKELIALAEKKGLILMVGHLLQYHPCVHKLHELVGCGELGQLQYITSNRLNLGSYRTEENALWNFAPHDISVILSLCGNHLPEQIRCVGEDYLSHNVADTTLTTLKFSGKVRAHIYVSWLNPFKEQKLTVVGSSGMAVFDDTKPWGEKLVLYRNHVTWSEGNVPMANSVTPVPMDPEQKEPLKEECLHFLKSCDERIPPHTDGPEALRVLKVLQGAQLSLNRDGEAVNPKHLEHGTLGEEDSYVHPTATLDPDADVGEGTRIWHYSHVMRGAKVGSRCRIGQNVFIGDGVILGPNTKVQNNVSIYAGVTCEDDVFLGPSMVFTNISNPRSEVVRRGQYLSTLVKKGATIGANSTIICGITLGEYCFIGAGAVVTRNVAPYALVKGNPARQTGWMSRHGEKLDLPVSTSEGKILEATCPSSGEKYILKGNRFEVVSKKESVVV